MLTVILRYFKLHMTQAFSKNKFALYSRVCLKIACCEMLSQFAVCLLSNSGGVVGYVDWIWQQTHREVGRHIAVMNFQTLSSTALHK